MLHLALILALAGPLVPQDGAAEAVRAPDTEAEARAAWQSFLDATRGGTQASPITAFRLSADVLLRQGVQTNQLRVDYRYLEPECIRFRLPNQKEVGRFGAKQREYWLRDRDEVVVLEGRDHGGDRKQIDEMFAIARNFVALSDPSRVSVSSLALLEAPPSEVPVKLRDDSEELRWLRVTSSDFALLRTDGSPTAAGTTYVVDLALEVHGLAKFVIIREQAEPGTPVAEPMFIRLDKFRDQNGFRIPFRFFVHRLDRDERLAVFAKKAAQEIYVTGADLRAKLSVEDFKP